MREPDQPNRPGPEPERWHFVLALAPIVLAALALGGLVIFHCARM